MIELCKKYLDDFKTVPYENRGMFNSEILAVVAVAKELNALVIESGMARGHSTETLAVNGVDVVSIDHNTDSDVQYAKKKLAKYDNVDLVHGDSRVVIYKYIQEPCIVLIDGPKGWHAVDFAKKLLAFDEVKYAFAHDLYNPNPDRDYAEGLLGGFYTDDKEYVEAFRHLDEQCWQELKSSGGIPERPYYRRKPIDSYASTLAVLQ